MSIRHRRRQVRFEYPAPVKQLVQALVLRWSRRLVARTLQIPVSSVYRWTPQAQYVQAAGSVETIEELVANCEVLGFFYSEPLRARGIELARARVGAESPLQPPFAAPSAGAAAAAPDRLQETRTFIERYYFRAITCDQLAAYAQMSKFHFIKEFSNHFGVTPHRYLVQTRVAHASRLLGMAQQSLHAIAIATGFNGVSSFMKAFRSLRGQSISAYRRACELSSGAQPADRMIG
jgi:AraC-like DNA-binding protein